MFFNLISNALKFTKKGHVKVSVREEEIERSLEELNFFEKNPDMIAEEWAKAKLVFKVEDTGSGMKQEDFEKLFGVFNKLKDDAGVNKSGVGLGLSICKRLVEQLGGQIVFNSQVGRGSTFSFSILAAKK